MSLNQVKNKVIPKVSDAKKKKQAKLLLLGMAGAGAVGLYLWWKNKPSMDEPLGELVTGGGGGAFLPEFEYEPYDPIQPEPTPTPTPEEQQPIIIQMGGGNGGGGYMPPITPTPTPEPKPIWEDIFPVITPTPSPTPSPIPTPVIPVVKAVQPPDILGVVKGALRVLPFTKYGFQFLEMLVTPKDYWNRLLGERAVEEITKQRPYPTLIPPVQAITGVQAYPKAQPSLTTPEGFTSTPVYRPQTLGFMPSFLKPSWMRTTATPQPATVKAQMPVTQYRSGQAWLI